MLVEYKDDIISNFINYKGKALLIHGCNCFNTMGKGLALQIKKNFPKAYYADKNTIKGWLGKLGSYTKAQYGDKIVINAYTQYYYGKYIKEVNLDYDALASVLEQISKEYEGYVIFMPRIGCGLANGDWNKVKSIIEEKLDYFNIRIYNI